MPIERTFALIKTAAMSHHPTSPIEAAITEAGLRILRICPFGTKIAPTDGARFERLYAQHAGRPYYTELLASVQPMSMAMILEGENAVAAWRTLIGPTDPVRARAEAPDSLRARFGGAALPDNAVHGSDSSECAGREIAIFFPTWHPDAAR